MFKKFLAAGVLAAACIGGIGSVYAADFSNHKTAVVYFTLLQNREMASNDSQADKKAGNAEVLATMIAEATNGDLYSLKTVKKYPADYGHDVLLPDRGKSAGMGHPFRPVQPALFPFRRTQTSPQSPLHQ